MGVMSQNDIYPKGFEIGESFEPNDQLDIGLWNESITLSVICSCVAYEIWIVINFLSYLNIIAQLVDIGP